MIDRLIKEITSRPLVINEFDERLWMVAVERVTVGVDGGMVFGFIGEIGGKPAMSDGIIASFRRSLSDF